MTNIIHVGAVCIQFVNSAQYPKYRLMLSQTHRVSRYPIPVFLTPSAKLHSSTVLRLVNCCVDFQFFSGVIHGVGESSARSMRCSTFLFLRVLFDVLLGDYLQSVPVDEPLT